MKTKVVKKPPRRAPKNVPNLFRPGETMDVAKPDSTSVKVVPLATIAATQRARGLATLKR